MRLHHPTFKLISYYKALLAFTLIMLLTACFGGGGGDGTASNSSTTDLTNRNTTASALSRLSLTATIQRPLLSTPITLLTVTARDTAGLPLVNVPVGLISNSDNVQFTNALGNTDNNGVFTTTVRDPIPESVTITAISNNISSNVLALTFDSVAGGLNVTAAQTIIALNKAVKVDVEVLSDKSSNVALAGRSPLQVSVTGSAQLANAPSTTDDSGKASFTVSDAKAENVSLTVNSGSSSQTLTLYFGASLQLLPTNNLAIGSSTLTALLKDANNTPLAGQEIQFGFANANAFSLSPTLAKTGADGSVNVLINDIAKAGGQGLIKASIGDLSAQATVNFYAQFGENRFLNVDSSGNVFGLNQTATLTATVTDKNGLPVTGQKITFTPSAISGRTSTVIITPNSGTTDAQGRISVTASSNVGENTTIIVQADTATQKVPLYFGAQLALFPSPLTGVADGITPVALTASLTDVTGAGISGVAVDARVKNGTALLDNFRVVTDEHGYAVFKAKNSTAEKTNFEVKAGGLAGVSVGVDYLFTGVPDTMTLASNLAADSSLSINGSAIISATVLDKKGQPVRDGTQVNFESNIGSITPYGFTKKGVATVTFNAGSVTGLVTILAKINVSEVIQNTLTSITANNSFTLTATTSLNIQRSDNVGTIEVKSIEPKVIGIIGSGVTQNATLQFLVKDSVGNPVADGKEVTFSLGSRLNGGESISTGNLDSSLKTKTTNGIASVTLRSGTVAGSVDVIASLDKISTVARVTIAGGLPDADHLSLAVEYRNIAGGVRLGLQDNLTAFVADRYGNVVPDATTVSFITEGGIIGKSLGGGTFTSTTNLGQATAVLQSANPTTPNLGGLGSLRTSGFACNSPYTAVSSATTSTLCGNPGLSTIIAFTTGSESYQDINGNGKFDAGTDRFTDKGYIDANSNGQWDMGELITNKGDLSEPYVDANDNGTYDSGEFYVDVNQNHRFDGPDGVFQENTAVWISTRVLFSADTAPITVSPSSFSLSNTGTQVFTIENVGDKFGNPLVAGSSYKVTTTNGVLGGVVDFVFSDSSSGNTKVQFTLSSNPPTVSTTGNPIYPNAAPAAITVKLVSPLKEQSPGGNGEVSFVITGSINNP
jgi:adhesin/invasin